MPDGPNPTPPSHPRRRFLRESLRGAVPLLFPWTRGGEGRPAGVPPDGTAATDPREAAPADAREELDRLHEDFVHDNGDLSRSLLPGPGPGPAPAPTDRRDEPDH